MVQATPILLLDIAATIVLFITIIRFILAKKNKNTIITVGALGDDPINVSSTIKSLRRSSAKKETAGKVSGESRAGIVLLLLEKLIPVAIKLLEKVKRSGFFVSELHLYTEYGAMIYINARVDSFKRKHRGIKYSDLTEEGVIKTNKEIYIKMIKEIFGDKIFYQKDSCDRCEKEVYEIQYNVSELEGSLKKSIGEEFFRQYDVLVGKQKTATFEEKFGAGF